MGLVYSLLLTACCLTGLGVVCSNEYNGADAEVHDAAYDRGVQAYLSAIDFHQKGDVTRALPLYKQAAKTIPNFAGAFNNIGKILKSDGKLSEASQYFDKAITADPSLPEPRVNLALTLWGMNKTEESIHTLLSASHLHPTHGATNFYLALLYEMEGSSEGAMSHYELALNKQSDLSQDLAEKAHANLALMYEKTGDHERAIQVYESALALNHDNHQAHTNIATLLRDFRGDMEGAVFHFGRALSIHPSPSTHFNLANALRLREILSSSNNNDAAGGTVDGGELARAEAREREYLQHYSYAVEMSPSEPLLHSAIASALHEDNDVQSAMVHYQKALDLDPSLVEARHMLEALRGQTISEKAPPEYVSQLFDGFAATYDEVMLRSLGYRVHTRLKDVLLSTLVEGCLRSSRFNADILSASSNAQMRLGWWMQLACDDAGFGYTVRVVDLGCGTGLVGESFGRLGNDLSSLKREKVTQTLREPKFFPPPALPPSGLTVEFHGVDLSREMLLRCADRPAYVRVIEGEFVDTLEGLRRQHEVFDMVLASDSLCYVGDLESLFPLVRSVLLSTGVFIFNTETLDRLESEEDYALSPSGRYVHADEYIARIAQEYDLRVVTAQSFSGREEYGEPVHMTAFILQAKPQLNV